MDNVKSGVTFLEKKTKFFNTNDEFSLLYFVISEGYEERIKPKIINRNSGPESVKRIEIVAV
jgi:hypothetical protein